MTAMASCRNVEIRSCSCIHVVAEYFVCRTNFSEKISDTPEIAVCCCYRCPGSFSLFHFSSLEVNFAGRMWKLGRIAICRNLRFQFQLNLGMASEKGRMHKVTRKDVIFSFSNLKCWIKFSTFYRLPGWLKILGFQILPVSNCQHLPNPFPASIVKVLTFHCKRTYKSNSWRI